MDWFSTPAQQPVRSHILAAGLALAVLLLLLAAPLARATGNTKPFAVTIAGPAGAVPATVAAGQSGTVTATVRNLSSSQTLGSANLTVPSGFQATAATIPSGTASITGSLVKLRSLALAPGAAVAVSVTLTAPASSVVGSCSPKTYSWPTPAAKQSNDFNGTGNDFSFTSGSSELRTVVNARCLLRFSTQPADSEPGLAISGTAYTPAGPPVAVEIVDASGQRVRCVGAQITLGLTGGQSGATLAGTTAVTTSSGTATFPGISVDLPASAYALTASAPGITSATSSAFRVQPSTFSVAVADQRGATPATVPTGTQRTLAVTYTNLSGGRTIGSSDLTLPVGLALVAASSPAGSAAVAGNTVQLRGLALAPGASVTVAVTVTAPCASAPQSLTWPTPVARTTSDFTGPVAFTLAPASSALGTALSGSCSLAFTAQPASADPRAPISSVPYDPSGAPVAVEVRDAENNRVTSSSTTIQLAIAANPSAGTLGGATIVQATAGLASFSPISIDPTGSGYTLRASAADATSDTSQPFLVEASSASVVISNPDGSTPAAVPNGEQAPLRAVITNHSGGRILRSADLALPAGLALVSASAQTGSATAVGNTIQVRALGLAPGASATVDLVAAAGCSAAARSLTWPTPLVSSTPDPGAAADFTVDAGSSDLRTGRTGSCSLAFVTQPHDADPRAVISGTAYDPAGGPVTVEVRDADNHRITGSTALVTLALNGGPDGAALAGGTAVAASGGLASFGDLSIAQAGTGYRLVASTDDASASTSDAFQVEPSTFSAGIAGPGTTSPATIPAGQLEDLTVSIANRTGGRPLGSADVAVPAGMALVSASSASGTAAVAGNTVQLRGLALAPGASTQATVRVEAACSAQSLTWDAPVAKASADFTGPAAFGLDAGASALTTSITGNCALHFVTPPAAASAGAVITGTPNDPSGPPVQVEILGGDGQRAGGSSATVTMTVAPGSGPGTLSGHTTRPATAGLATFADLSLDQPGNYAFTASSTVAPPITTVVPPVTSPPFPVSGLTVSCPEDVTCTGTLPLSSPGSSIKVTAIEGPTTDTDTGLLTLSLGTGGNLDCALYTEVTSPQDIIAVDYTALDRQKTVATTLPKSALAPFIWHDDGDADDIYFLQDCFGAPYTFAVRLGTPLQVNAQYTPGPYPAPEYKGLLPDCGGPARLDNPATPAIDGPFVAHAGAPCVQSRVRTTGGGATITSLWPSGRQLGSPLDPRGRS